MPVQLEDGGPAFPQTNEQRYNDPIHGVIRPSDISGDAHPGMSLRDYFAGQALVGLSLDPRIANAMAERLKVPPTLMLAKIAYDFADAMLEAREK